ncbi:MAG: hypothetical protein IT371_14130 [Deltaproteobacteria bacterium]|nr:hypothetical protein [Deltaproteobacteria bacterium]
MRRALNVLVCLLPCACASSQRPEVVDVRQVSAARGAPRLARVVDLGTGGVQSSGALALPAGEGRAVIGELLALLGSSFGKQPTVTIAGLPAEVLAHLDGGGVVVRVPRGVDPGPAALRVTNEYGSSERAYPVRRLALVVARGAVRTVALSSGGALERAGDLPLPGGRLVALSSEGSLAYVAGETDAARLWVLDLTGSAPRLVKEHRLPGRRVQALAAATRAPLGVVVTDSHLVVVDGRQVLPVALYAPRELPRALLDRPVVAASVADGGERLALLLADKNEVALFDARDPARLGEPTLLTPMAEARLPLALQLTFTPDGKLLWLLAGDNPRSIEGGFLPAQLAPIPTSVGPDGQLASPSPATIALPHAVAPLSLALGPREPTPPGTAIRTESGSSALYAGVAASAALKEAGASEARGQLLRVGRGDRPEVVHEGTYYPAGLAVTGLSQRLLVLACRGRAGSARATLLSLSAWERSPSVTEQLLGPAPAPSATPLSCGALAAQP